jgi:hypothetical protein
VFRRKPGCENSLMHDLIDSTIAEKPAPSSQMTVAKI